MSGTSDDVGRDMEIELAQLEAKRSSIKGQTTKIEKFLKSFDDSEAVDAVGFNKLTLKLHKCMELIQKFETLQSRIEVLNSGKLEEELTTRDTMEENLHNCIATVQFLLEKHKLKSSSGADNTNSSTITHHSHCRDTIVGFNLPQIKINKFDGTFYKWLEFRDTYESLIHDNISLKPIHKFHYLCSYLEGEAARVISNLEISAANYSEAWTLLCERYNNKRQLIYNHLNSLFSVDAIQRESDKSLRFLGDHITKNLRALKTLGQPTEQWDTIIIHLATTKLDSVTSVKWEEYRNGLTSEIPTLKDFKEFLKSLADVLETLYRSKRDKQARTPSSSHFKQNNHHSHHKQDFQTKSFVISANNGRQLRPCVICQGKHRIFDCNAFKALTTEEKWAQVPDVATVSRAN
ncbi:uncharacterized protein LOC126380861 [Pectinophora gossypiella]|nr:uncharacterized protein LOC126380861 [Pectinophora gossypiella]